MKLLLICLLTLCSLSIAQTGTIRGRVVDENGEALIGANVEVMELQGRGASTTDADPGNFEIADVPVGVYSLRITCIGYQSRYIRNVDASASENESITIRLEDDNLSIHSPDYLGDENFAKFKLRVSKRRSNNPQAILGCGNIFDGDYYALCDRGVLVGSIRGSQSEQISSCEAFLNDQKVELIPDEIGSWKIAKVVPGVYTFRVNAAGYAPFVQDSVVIERCHQHEIAVTLKRAGVE